MNTWKPHAIGIDDGVIWETEEAPDVADLLGHHYSGCAVLAGFCGGTHTLARASL